MSALRCRHAEKCADCRKRPRTALEKAAFDMYAALKIALDFIGDFESSSRPHMAARAVVKDALKKATP